MPFKASGDHRSIVALSAASLALAFVALVMSAGLAVAAPVKIVAFGDSLMAGYQLGPREGFVPQLRSALQKEGLDVEVVDAAVSGDTTSGGAARLDWSVPDDADIVLLELGANDMLRGLPVAAARDNLDAMLTGLQERGIAVVLFGMRAAPQLGADYVRQFEAIYPDLASTYDVPLVPFFLDGVTGDASMQLSDRLHPNAEGVARMVANSLPAIVAAVEAEAPAAD